MSLNLCIPKSIGVPFENNQPPNWLLGAMRQDKTLDDARWRGTTEQTFNDNGSNEAEFRALTDQSQTFLYLSWQVKLDMDGANNNQDILYVGFVPDPAHGGSGPAFIVQLTLQVQGNPPGTRDWLDRPNFNITPTYTRTGTGTAATWNTPNPDGNVLGTWLQDTRLWASSPTFDPNQPSIPWAFQMKIPLGIPIVKQGANGPTTTLGTSFKIWYSFAIAMPTPLQVKQITWPSNAAHDYDVSGGITNPLVLPNPDAPTAPWGTVTLGNCPAQGVSLDFGRVGRMDPTDPTVDPTTIDLNKANFFFANPTNNTGGPIPANTIFARFRLANWGSLFTGAAWDDIPVGHHVANNIGIPALPALPAGHPILSQGWTLTQPERDKYKTGGTLNPHQCMLVQLSSDIDITFDSDSTVQNMNFVPASLVTEDAEISLAGLPETADAHRDVYLYVERLNLPSHIESNPCKFDQKEDSPLSIEEQRAELNRKVQEGNFSLKDAAKADMPTYRVHVYHSTGQKLALGGVERDIVHIQPSFGFFLLHDGPLFGWDHRLQGAEQIALNYYRLAKIPDGKAAKVTISVEGLERPRGARNSGFMVQSTVGTKGNFELVVPSAKGGLANCLRNNDAQNLPWEGPEIFGTELGQVDAVALIQSNFGPLGSLEVIARVGDRLVHFWRGANPRSRWNGPTTIITQGVSGNPALIQSSLSKRGNFELIIPLKEGGIVHYWRDNDAARPQWQGGTFFAKRLGQVEAVALLQSNIGQPQPGHLEVIARVKEDLIHFWRDDGPNFKWSDSDPVKFYEGATGIPGFIQSNFGSKGNFEVVTPSIKGGMVHLWRNNDEPKTFPWKEVATFGKGNVTAVSLLQSNFTMSSNPNIPGPGDFEVAARIDGRTAHYWRWDLAPLDWDGPTAYACS
jgi:hypothetical protein